MTVNPTTFDEADLITRTGRAVDAALGMWLTPETGPPRLVDAMGYSLLAGGKRLRPLLLLTAAEIHGLPAAQVMPAACAVEMVHTYSLIHDDLPAMDNDDFRRGRPTSHKVFGEAMAILAGDGLLTLSFQVLSTLAANPRVGPERALQAVAELAAAAGPAGMVGGQVDDLAWEGAVAPAAVLESIHRRKTGRMITASLRIGGVLAGAEFTGLAALTAYGDHLGLAFQIQDDILDVVGNAAQTGKGTGRDAKHDKSTYVRLFGLERAREMASQSVAAALAALVPLGESAAPLIAIAQFAIARQH